MTILPGTGARRAFVVRSLGVACLIGLSLVSGGCGAGSSAGAMRVQSLGDDPVMLAGSFTSAYYSHDDERGTSFMLSDVPVDDVIDGTVQTGQIVHVELLWMPKPGSTPLDPSATNASIRYVVCADGELGLYGGAGFAMPSGSPGDATLTLTIRDASLQLQESTPGFRDLLSPAQMTGTFTARRNDKRARELHVGASQLVTNRLGHTRFVLAK